MLDHIARDENHPRPCPTDRIDRSLPTTDGRYINVKIKKANTYDPPLAETVLLNPSQSLIPL